MHLADRRPGEYLRDDGPRVAAALEWLLWLRAFGMLVVAPPPLGEGGPVRLAVAPGGRPTAATAVLRLVTGLPLALALWVAGAALIPAWLAGCGWLALTGRLPRPVRAAHLALLRAEAAFLARHASLTVLRPYAEPVRRHSSAPQSGQRGSTRMPSFSFGDFTSRSHSAQRKEPVTSSPTSNTSSS